MNGAFEGGGVRSEEASGQRVGGIGRPSPNTSHAEQDSHATGLTKRQHNDIVVFVIPPLVDNGGPWKIVPPGVHDATLDEVRASFAINPRRKNLFKGLTRACKSLKAAGCMVVFLDGSYVTDKPNPGDYDVCWDPTNVDPIKLDPVFLDFKDKRATQKSKYGGEFFLSSGLADGTNNFVEYFQNDKETGTKKGIICIHLSRRKKRHEP
jgi:hypothetical protein